MIVVSCSKNDDISKDCLLMLIPFSINFNIVDASGEDLFFSDAPHYDTDSLKIYRIMANVKQPLSFSIEEQNMKYFKFNPPAGSRDTCFIKLSQNEIDTLIYIGSFKQQDICSQYQLDTVLFNNVHIRPDQETGHYKFIR